MKKNKNENKKYDKKASEFDAYFSKFGLMWTGVSKKRLFVLIIFICAYAFLQGVHDDYISGLPDAIIGGYLSHFLLYYVGLLVAWIIAEFVLDICEYLLCEEYECSGREIYFRIMNETKPETLRKYNTGYIAGLVDKFTFTRENLALALISLPLDVVYTAYMLTRLGSYDIVYAGVGILIFVLSNTLRVFFNKIGTEKAIALANSESEYASIFLDSGTNIGTVQKMQAFDFMDGRLNKQQLKCMKAAFADILIGDGGFIVQKSVTYAFLPLCLLISANLGDAWPISFYIYLGLCQIRFIHSSRQLAECIKRYVKYSGSYRKLNSILHKGVARQPLADTEFECAEVRDLDYSYDREDIETKKKERIRVRIPAFRINKGDKVCICGESGQGKTTLLNILSGEIESENVYINGEQSLKRLPCVFISQDTEIFDMSLRDNLRLGNEDITDELIIEMLGDVGLKEWFDRQPEGLDVRLGERGVFVSTGQRQRLNLIRGLLKTGEEIYLLDEPTSNVDETTELKMIDVINKHLSDKTLIVVTHRPNIMRICNRFYVFKDGVLSEQEGTEI